MSWVWSQGGINYINKHGSLNHLGNPAAGDVVTSDQKQKIIDEGKWAQALEKRAILGVQSSLLQEMKGAKLDRSIHKKDLRFTRKATQAQCGWYYWANCTWAGGDHGTCGKEFD